MTPLRRRMIEDMRARNLAAIAVVVSPRRRTANPELDRGKAQVLYRDLNSTHYTQVTPCPRLKSGKEAPKSR